MQNFTRFLFLTGIVCFVSCKPKPQADLLLHNARIYSVDSVFTVYEAMAITDGKIMDLGTNHELLKKYTAAEITDAKGRSIFPGFIDAHCHFVGYGLGLRQANLVGTPSFEDVLQCVSIFSRKNPGPLDGSSGQPDYNGSMDWLIGRGWDQNDWEDKAYPDRRKLDSLFPDRPVLLVRVDGHAALANGEALKRAGITESTKIEGGEILRSGKKSTGILIDNAVDLIKNKIPPPTTAELAQALLAAQQNCLREGLTTLDDAGLMKSDVDLIDSLQRAEKLKIRIYAMLSDSLPNYEYYLQHGPYKTGRLNVCSFKFYADGALGSRGACLHQDYEDKPGWRGFLLSSRAHFEKQAELLAGKGFQVNTHCIGDSALSMILEIYAKYCDAGSNRRWRVEHAQVVAPGNFRNFSRNIIPSVQPTHATSDMYWAASRLGKTRVKQAYAYGRLLKSAGIIALGTDFPVEDISPFKTFFAAVARQDSSGFPARGFQKENALTREQTLRGMTIWAAYANFEEKEKGSLEKGKLADFIILDTDLVNCAVNDVLKARVLATYIGGEKVFSQP
jgi:predicted amidohydrolase YtcJ